MFNSNYPLQDALQELICDFQNIGNEFIQDLQDLEPEIENVLDEIEAQYPDLSLEEAIIKFMMDNIADSSSQKVE